jgi:hypothetical protein
MANLEIEGKIYRKLAPQSGTSARGTLSKQDFVLEYPDGNFTAQACFTAFGDDKVAELGKFAEGDTVRVSFNLRAREYNGRWYNDLRVWRLAPAGQAAPAPAAAPAAPAAMPPAAPAPTLDDMPASADDDLPF